MGLSSAWKTFFK